MLGIIIIAVLVVLVCITVVVVAQIKGKTKRIQFEMEKRADILEKALEKSKAEDVDVKALSIAFDGMKGSLKYKVIGQLRWGITYILLGVAGFVLEYGVGIDSADIMPVVSGALLAIGVAYVIIFVFSKIFLKEQIEEEDRILTK